MISSLAGESLIDELDEGSVGIGGGGEGDGEVDCAICKGR